MLEITPLDAHTQYLNARNFALEIPQRPPRETTGENQSLFFKRQMYVEPDQQNSRDLLEFTARLGPNRVSKFLTHPYVYENLQFFLARNEHGDFNIAPEKVDLALSISEKIDTLANIHNFEPQFLGAINIVSYTTIEYLRDHGLADLELEQIKSRLKDLAAKEQRSAQITESGKKGEGHKDTKIRGKSAIVRHLSSYAHVYEPEKDGEFEDFVLRSLAMDVHGRLVHFNNELSLLEQPQGYEVEVLKYVTKSPRAIERGVDHWLPRGIPSERLERTDWQLVPLLGSGLHEDIGERPYQRFEIATDPTEAVSAQMTTIYALTAAGFFTEAELTERYEGYSMHVSTIFPKDMLTEASLRDYHKLARSIAAAFASDQRIGFGGFLSGGSEITDKSLAGTLKEVAKIKDIDSQSTYRDVPKDFALVEIRNLDLTSGTHYSALLTKQYLDYAFKCYWKTQLHPQELTTRIEHRSAAIWESYMKDLSQIFAEKGITDDNSIAWKQVAQANESDPKFRGQMQALLRRNARLLRAAMREQANTELERKLLKIPHFVISEPLSQDADRLFLSKEYRDKMGLKEGDVIMIKFGEKSKKVTVAQARIRGNGKPEKANKLRISKNVIDELSISTGTPVSSKFDRVKRELTMETIDKPTLQTIVDRSPRTLQVESTGMVEDRIYMSPKDREKYGLKPGDEIVLRFGQVIRKIRIAQSKIHTVTADKGKNVANWKLSRNIFTDMSIPENLKLRTKFDHSKKELSFGPLIGIFNNDANPKFDDDTNPNDSVFGNRSAMLRQLRSVATEMGGLAVIINPQSPENKSLTDGMVAGYIDDGKGGFKKVRLPFPDVVYDKQINWHGHREVPFEDRLQNTLGHPVEVKYVFPPSMQGLTLNKDTFNNLFGENEYLEPFLPDSRELRTQEDLAEFLEDHPKIFLKPVAGQQGLGLMRLEQIDGEYTYEYVYQAKDEWMSTKKTTRTIDELYSELAKLRMGKSPFLMQEYLDIVTIDVETPGESVPTRKRAIELRNVIQRGIDKKTGITGVVARLTDRDLTQAEYEMDGLQALLKAFPPEKAERIYTQVQRLSMAVTKHLEQYLNAPIGEITIDIAVTADGQVYILEGNSKAGTRGMFDRVGNQDALRSCLENPIQYAFAVTQYN